MGVPVLYRICGFLQYSVSSRVKCFHCARVGMQVASSMDTRPKKLAVTIDDPHSIVYRHIKSIFIKLL